MRATLILVAALFLLPFAPTASATPTCQALDRIAGPAHVHTESCYDFQSFDGYTYESWWNSTYVQANGPSAGAAVVDSNYHSVQRDPNGALVWDYQTHGYNVVATPAANPALSYAQVGVGDTQYRYGASCNEVLGGGSYGVGPLQQGSLGENVALGGSSPLPCTDGDTQATLP